MMKGKFICLIGIDGSGKTTLIRETIKRLNKKGIQLRYVWGSYELCLLKPIIVWGKRLFLGNKNPKKDYKSYIFSINKVGENKFLSICYQTAVIIEYVFQIFFKIALPLIMRQNVISDRYIYDAVINMKVNLCLKEQTMYRIIAFLSKIVPIPDLIIFVDVPEEIAFSRKTDTPSIDYLKIRKDLFKKIAECHGAILLDGTKPIEELYHLMEKSIQSL